MAEVGIGEIVGRPKAERKAHSQAGNGGFKRVRGPGSSPVKVSGYKVSAYELRGGYSNSVLGVQTWLSTEVAYLQNL